MALFSTHYDLVVPVSGELLARLVIHALCREGEGIKKKKKELFEAREGVGSVKSGERKSPA